MRQVPAADDAGDMKVVNYAMYVPTSEMAVSLRPAHREYLTRLHSDGRLLACGPLTGESPGGASGALFIYEAGSIAAAREILAADPYEISGVFTHCQLSQWEVIKSNPDLLRAIP